VLDLKGIILHGGYGTRLRSLMHTGPRQLIPVANKPISQYVLEDIIEAEINEIAVVLGNTYPERVREHYGHGNAFDVKITYIPQGEHKKHSPRPRPMRKIRGRQVFHHIGNNS